MLGLVQLHIANVKAEKQKELTILVCRVVATLKPATNLLTLSTGACGIPEMPTCRLGASAFHNYCSQTSGSKERTTRPCIETHTHTNACQC